MYLTVSQETEACTCLSIVALRKTHLKHVEKTELFKLSS